MSAKEQREPERNRIENIAKVTFGYDDDSLLAEFIAAEQEAKELHNKGSLRAESGLEELKERLHKLDIHPIYQVDYDKENMPEGSEKKPVRLKRMKKMVFIAAVMGVLILAGGVVSFGKKSLKYWKRETWMNQSRVVWNNVDEVVGDLVLEEAYQQIEDSLGIRVIQLGYIPEGMEYKGMVIENGYANMKFLYREKIITVIQKKPTVEQSMSVNVDRKIYDKIENVWIGQEITLSRNQLDNNQMEYQGDIVAKDAMYSLQGIMDEEEFHKMLEYLFY